LLTRPALSTRRLRAYLDRFVQAYDYDGHLRRDPLHLVLPYEDPADREVAGFLAACLAYGIVKRVVHSVKDVLGRLGPRPAEALRSFDFDDKRFKGFLHRMTGEVELRALCTAMGGVLRRHGSLEGLFAEGHDGPTVRAGLEHLVETVRPDAMSFIGKKRVDWHRRRIKFLLPSPKDGGACKRMNLWLRWMIRRTRPDRGAWTAARPSELVIPLDTHIIRLSRFMGFTARATPDWKMAEEITSVLRRLDPEDPMKYDFALCHLGISGDCRHERDATVCAPCPIEKACRL